MWRCQLCLPQNLTSADDPRLYERPASLQAKILVGVGSLKIAGRLVASEQARGGRETNALKQDDLRHDCKLIGILCDDAWPSPGDPIRS